MLSFMIKLNRHDVDCVFTSKYTYVLNRSIVDCASSSSEFSLIAHARKNNVDYMSIEIKQ